MTPKESYLVKVGDILIANESFDHITRGEKLKVVSIEEYYDYDIYDRMGNACHAIGFRFEESGPCYICRVFDRVLTVINTELKRGGNI